jgi:membrane-bound ClpP family serine protease
MKQSIKFLLIIADEVLIGSFLILLLYYYGGDIWSYVVVLVILFVILIFIAYIFLPQLKKPVTGTEGMVGQTGESVEELNPTGIVKIRGELWNAESINGRIGKGLKIIVEKVDGLELKVKIFKEIPIFIDRQRKEYK